MLNRVNSRNHMMTARITVTDSPGRDVVRRDVMSLHMVSGNVMGRNLMVRMFVRTLSAHMVARHLPVLDMVRLVRRRSSVRRGLVVTILGCMLCLADACQGKQCRGHSKDQFLMGLVHIDSSVGVTFESRYPFLIRLLKSIRKTCYSQPGSGYSDLVSVSFLC